MKFALYHFLTSNEAGIETTERIYNYSDLTQLKVGDKVLVDWSGSGQLSKGGGDLFSAEIKALSSKYLGTLLFCLSICYYMCPKVPT